MSGLSPTTGISGGVRNINDATIINSNISAGNFYISGGAYPPIGFTSGGAGTIMVANTIYAMPFYTLSPVTGLTQIRMANLTGGTASNAKLGMATFNGSAATMITDLDPTPVPTTGTGNITGTFSPINLKGHYMYLMCIIGAGTVMPVPNGISTGTVNTWAVGSTGTLSGGWTGFTATGSTYAGGFASTFTLTRNATNSIPWFALIAP